MKKPWIFCRPLAGGEIETTIVNPTTGDMSDTYKVENVESFVTILLAICDGVLVIVTSDPAEEETSAFLRSLSDWMWEMPTIFYSRPLCGKNTAPEAVAKKCINSDLFDLLAKL